MGNWNGNNVNTLLSNNWRTSPVPAPAVIPAPVMYLEVAAVKTLVVEADPCRGTTPASGAPHGAQVGCPGRVSSLPLAPSAARS